MPVKKERPRDMILSPLDGDFRTARSGMNGSSSGSTVMRDREAEEKARGHVCDSPVKPGFSIQLLETSISLPISERTLFRNHLDLFPGEVFALPGSGGVDGFVVHVSISLANA